MPRGSYLTKWIELEQGYANRELKTLIFPAGVIGQVVDVVEPDKVAPVDTEDTGL